jgi:hypothetical protein
MAELQYRNGNQVNTIKNNWTIMSSFIFSLLNSKPNTIFLRIDTKAGHGAGKPTSMIIEEHTDKLAYAAEVMDLEWND